MDSSDQNASQNPSEMPGWRRGLGEVGPYLGLGMQIALSLAFFVAIGYALDQWLDILPWGTVAGALIGMASIFYHLLRVVNEMNRTSSARKRQRDAAARDAGGASAASKDEE